MEAGKINFESKVLEFIRLKGTVTRNLPLFGGVTFSEEEVYVDFNHYENCTFDKCSIIIEYGLSRLNNCKFNKCRFITTNGSPAYFVLQLDRMIRESSMLEENK